MRCSECSRVVLPIVAVDIDGTLGMYHEHFRRFAEEYLDQQLPADYAGGMEYSDYLGLPKEVYRMVKLAYRQGGMKRTMPSYIGAGDFMNWLQVQDVELWMTTTRPHMRLDNLDPDTREWLRRMNIQPAALLYHDDKYHQLAEQVDKKRIITIVDDLGEQIMAAEREFEPGVAVQITRPHNRNETCVHHVGSFDRLRELIDHRLLAWKVRHGQV